VRGADPLLLLSMTASVDVQPVLPDSNPGLAKSCELVVQLPPTPLTVTDTVVLCEPDAAVPVTVRVKVPAAAAVVW
jgi:hypothetical protein